MFRKVVILSVLALVAGTMFVPTASAYPAGATKAADLLAGKTMDVGDVYVWNDAANLYVEYVLVQGWCMKESHLAVAASLASIPQAKGNPIPGKFAYGMHYDPCGSGDTFTIPLAGLGSSPYIAAHAEVWSETRSESAWGAMGEGGAFSGKNWATYFTYEVRHGIMSNQDGYGAQFAVFGDPAWLKFSAFAGTTGDLGDLDWRWGNTPTIAFSGDITSATKNVAGEWELVVDITTVTANGGLADLTDACTISFYVKDGTPDTTEGWAWWSAPPACNFGAYVNSLPLVSGSYTEF